MNIRNKSTLPMALMLSFLLTSCNQGGAGYILKQENIVPDNRTITESDAINNINGPKDQDQFRSMIYELESRKTPNFNWSKFWDFAYRDRIVLQLTPTNLETFLSLNNNNCKSYEISSFADYINAELIRVTDSEKQKILLNEYIDMIKTCRKAAPVDVSAKIIKHTTAAVQKSSSPKMFTEVLLDLTSTLKTNLSEYDFNKTIEQVSLTEWYEVSSSLKAKGDPSAILDFLKIINMLDSSKQVLLRGHNIDFLANNQPIAQSLQLFAVDETLLLLNEYGDQLYSQGNKRDLKADTLSLTNHIANSAGISRPSDIDNKWKQINLVKNIIDKYSTQENFNLSMTHFNRMIKQFESDLLSVSYGSSFINALSSVNILAKWIELRMFNFQQKRHSPIATNIRDYTTEESKIDTLLKKRVAYYTEASDKASAKEEYCEYLNSIGIKGIKITNLTAQLKAIQSNGGCHYLNDTKSQTVDLGKYDELIFDDDAVLTINNANVNLSIVKKLDLNFLDLSATRKHAPIPYQETPLEYDMITIPLLLGVQDKVVSRTKYFLYFYELRKNRNGPAYSSLAQEKGHNGGNLSLYIGATANGYYPQFTSQGGEGQVAERPRRGGHGVDFEIEIEKIHLPNLSFSNTLSQDEDGLESLKEILNHPQFDENSLEVVDYISSLEGSTSSLLRDQASLISEQSRLAAHHLETCLQSDEHCVMRAVANKALKSLRSQLLLLDDDEPLDNLSYSFYRDQANPGPMPEQGERGDQGSIIVKTLF